MSNISQVTIIKKNYDIEQRSGYLPKIIVSKTYTQTKEGTTGNTEDKRHNQETRQGMT